jgi:gliding motility-associated-like protein
MSINIEDNNKDLGSKIPFYLAILLFVFTIQVISAKSLVYSEASLPLLSTSFDESFSSNTIDNGDTIVFDLTSSTIVGNIFTFPVSFISDDPITALDFSFNFNNTDFTYTSVSNPNSIDQVLAFVNPVDLKLRLTSNDLMPYSTSTVTFELSFTTTATDVCDLNINNIAAFLNGEPCSFLVLGCVNPPAFAGADQEICSDFTLLAANNPLSGLGTWSVVSGSGTFQDINDPATSVSNLSEGDNIFRWTIPPTGGSPLTFDEVIINTSAPPSIAIVGNDQTVCESNTVLSAQAPLVGIGEWSIIEGIATIEDPNDPASNTTNLNLGNTVFVWTVTNGSCPSNSAQLIIFRQDTVFAGPDQTQCDSSTQLNALIPSSGSGIWSLVSGSGTIVNPNLANSEVIGLQQGENIFEWSVSGGDCPSSSDQVSITINCNIPPIINSEVANVNEDDTFSGNILENGDNDPDGTNLVVNTTTVSGPLNGTILILDNGEFAYTPSTNYYGVDTVLIEVCDQGLPLPALCGIDTLFVNVLPINDAPDIQNESYLTIINLPISGNITLNDSDIENTVITANSTLVSGPNNGTFIISSDGSFTYLPDLDFIGSDTIVVSVCDSGFPLPEICVNDTIFIQIVVPPFQVNAGSDTTICINQITLIGSDLPTGANGVWSVSAGGGIIISPTTSTTEIQDILQGENEFVWTVTLDGFSISDSVVITLNEPVSIALAGIDIDVCGNSTQLNANIPEFGVGTWTSNSGAIQIENPSSASSGVSGLLNGLNELVWTINNGNCSNSDTVQVNSLPIAFVNAGLDTSICPNVQPITLPIEVGSGLEWNWFISSGNGTITNENTFSPQFNNLSSGENIFVLTSGQAPCQDSDTLVILLYNSNDLLCSSNLIFIPDGFSPNGDGSHDFFVIENLNGLQADVQIFNRYGNIVFQQENYQNDWNGTANSGVILFGELLPEGTYYYTIEIEGETVPRQNFLTLWR